MKNVTGGAKDFSFWAKAFVSLAVVALVLINGAGSPSPAQASTWVVGDVFAGVGNGQYQVYSNTGVFKETISQGMPGFTTGCAFNSAGDLYTTNFSQTKVVVLAGAHPHSVLQVIDTAAQSPGGQSESIVFAANGHFYVGHPFGDQDIHRYNAVGAFQQKYDVAFENVGSDWIDLAVDQQTMFYTSEGRRILRFNVSGAGAQMGDFATLPNDGGTAFALRLLSPGDGSGGLLVADLFEVKRLDGSGMVVQTYDVSGEDSWFSLALDPDGLSFWAGNFNTGNFYKINIATGAVLVTVNTGVSVVGDEENQIFTGLFGLCILGEPTAGVTVPTSTPGKVTLGGFIDPVTGEIINPSEILLQNGPSIGGKATFGGVVQFQVGDPNPTGNMRYIDHVTGDDVKVTSYSSLVISSPGVSCPLTPGSQHAKFAGKGKVNGIANQDFEVEVDDCGEPGSESVAGPDTLKMTVMGPNVFYLNFGPLVGGNIQIHKQ